ncbi:MAG: hypothetical protein ACLPKT_19710, partial [Methylocella sp.]
GPRQRGDSRKGTPRSPAGSGASEAVDPTLQPPTIELPNHVVRHHQNLALQRYSVWRIRQVAELQ